MKIHLYLFALLVFYCSCSTNRPVLKSKDSEHNSLSAADRALGWELLFDGTSMSQWRQYKKESLEGWTVENNEMIALGIEGLSADIITRDTFRNFELSLEWKISKGGNSGIFFHVQEEDHLSYIYESGPEYQLLDDQAYTEQAEDWQLSGANYAMHPPMVKTNLQPGNYNHTRLIVDEGRVQHWLNDVLVVDYQLWTEEWDQLKKSGKWKDYPDYGKYGVGHIELQDHGNKIHFRNIKIRRR